MDSAAWELAVIVAVVAIGCIPLVARLLKGRRDRKDKSAVAPGSEVDRSGSED
jgi:hypothetical protein